jgi:hypothetical protein
MSKYDCKEKAQYTPSEPRYVDVFLSGLQIRGQSSPHRSRQRGVEKPTKIDIIAMRKRRWTAEVEKESGGCEGDRGELGNGCHRSNIIERVNRVELGVSAVVLTWVLTGTISGLESSHFSRKYIQ